MTVHVSFLFDESDEVEVRIDESSTDYPVDIWHSSRKEMPSRIASMTRQQAESLYYSLGFALDALQHTCDVCGKRDDDPTHEHRTGLTWGGEDEA